MSTERMRARLRAGQDQDGSVQRGENKLPYGEGALDAELAGMVRALAFKRFPHLTADERQDVVQAGLVAAWGAEQRWAPVGAARLTTYAYPEVLRAMAKECGERHQSTGVRIPPGSFSKVRREPGPLRDAVERALAFSANGLTSGLATAREELHVPDFSEELAEDLDAWALLDSEALSDRQRLVVELTVLGDMTDRECGLRLGVDHSTVSRERNRALRMMRLEAQEEMDSE